MDSDEISRLWLLGALWLGYFILHSWLSAVATKRKISTQWPGAMRYYRVTFNLLAAFALLPLVFLIYGFDYRVLWQWQGLAGWLANGLTLLAIGGFIWSSRFYDSSEFLGLKQMRENIIAVEDQEQFHISPLHRFVRHPWYSLGLVLIWTRNMDTAYLLTAVLATIYLIIGSRLEERKLQLYHGPRYQTYQQKVPGLIPLPWRYLSKEQAQSLINASDTGDR